MTASQALAVKAVNDMIKQIADGKDLTGAEQEEHGGQEMVEELRERLLATAEPVQSAMSTEECGGVVASYLDPRRWSEATTSTSKLKWVLEHCYCRSTLKVVRTTPAGSSESVSTPSAPITPVETPWGACVDNCFRVVSGLKTIVVVDMSCWLHQVWGTAFEGIDKGDLYEVCELLLSEEDVDAASLLARPGAEVGLLLLLLIVVVVVFTP